ncbi:transcription factor grauzone-like [Sabethes cyaneus]|uniref:transcription factor grauzone-like n=1 Tax=Sabethes cyaneus TaxID=53552 RepID=UPI00237EA7CE|nr:transcription factor grauzone-like [Sabethes cyaneus]
MATDRSQEADRHCLTCWRKPLNFYRVLLSGAENQTQPDVCAVLCQHFWFQEENLYDDIICKVCWEKVSEFHQFYLEVEKHHQETPKPIKQEIEKTEAPSQDAFTAEQDNDDTLLPVDIVKTEFPQEGPVSEWNVQSEVETSESDANHSEYEPEPDVPEPRKKRKYTRRSPNTKAKEKAKKEPYPYVPKTPEERESEDRFIRQHTRYVCEDCNVEFEQFHVFQRHSLQTHGKEGFITCCGIRHRKRSVLLQHVQHALNPEAFKCELCGKTYKNRFGYNRHKKESHATEEERTFKCHRCPKSFVKQGALKRHLDDHETLDNGTAKCETCGKCFSNVNILKNHVKYRHVKQMEYICDVCSKGFYMRSAFVTHRKTHEVPAEELRKQCPVCSKWCKNHDYWRVHVRRHKNEGKISCDLCGHVSPNLMALKGHKARMHSGPRIFPCSLCGKEYARAITLKEHVAAAHTGDVLYTCPHCEKTFNSSANMHSHRKKMHPKEWLEQRLAKYGSQTGTATSSGQGNVTLGIGDNSQLEAQK